MMANRHRTASSFRFENAEHWFSAAIFFAANCVVESMPMGRVGDNGLIGLLQPWISDQGRQ